MPKKIYNIGSWFACGKIARDVQSGFLTLLLKMQSFHVDNINKLSIAQKFFTKAVANNNVSLSVN